jgi:hypothetical protein
MPNLAGVVHCINLRKCWIRESETPQLEHAIPMTKRPDEWRVKLTDGDLAPEAGSVRCFSVNEAGASLRREPLDFSRIRERRLWKLFRSGAL